MATKKTKKKNTNKLTPLISAAEDLNTVLELDPEIETEDRTEEQLLDDLKESAEILEEKDKIALSTRNTLIDIGAIEGDKKIKPKKKTTKKAAPKEEKVPKKKTKAAPKEKASAKKKVEKAAPKEKAPVKLDAAGDKVKLYKARQPREGGVVQEIFKIIEKHGPITRDKLLDKMVKKFPDREPSGMKLTINQETCPAALYYRKPLEVDEKGKFSIK